MENKKENVKTENSNLPISNVISSSLTKEDINKQAYLVMSNINAVKITTDIDDKKYNTLMKSFLTLQGMFNDYLKQKGVD